VKKDTLKSDDTMFLPVGKSDVAFGATCASGTLRIIICHCERSVAISRKGNRIKNNKKGKEE
ncbi:MAG: hypothetical protein SPH55_03070, partial [Eubacteriales bacterium]|nr:hypothetical protein [Eubacteriales bacterium]